MSRGKVQVALEELVAGGPSAFSEKACREKYRSRMNTIQVVKASANSNCKHVCMMSNIYQGTMYVFSSLTVFRQITSLQRNYLENGWPTPGPTNVVTVDLGCMAV